MKPVRYALTLTIFLLATPCFGAISHVQQASNSDVSGTSHASFIATFGSATTSGNAIILGVTFGNVNPTITVTDSQGNTYAQAIKTYDSGHNQGSAIFYATNITGGASNTVTVNFSDPVAYLAMGIHEYSGIAASLALDGTAGNLGNGASLSSGLATTTVNGDLIFGVGVEDSVGSGDTFTAGAGFGKRVDLGSAAAYADEDQIQPSAGQIAGTWILSPDFLGWISDVAAFKAASGGGAGPSITNLSPASGPVGTGVTIVGTNFGATQGSSTVIFNGTQATPSSWSTTSILVRVPSGATTGNVVVNVGGVASNGVTFTLPPSVTSFSPNSGPVGTVVTIAGTNFGTAQGTVTIGGAAAPIQSWSPTSIAVQVPSSLLSGLAAVVVNAAGKLSNSPSFMVRGAPRIFNVSSTTATPGAQVTIIGVAFGSTSGTVLLGNTNGAIESWSDTQIVATVASAAESGVVQVFQGTSTSNQIAFTVVFPATISASASPGPNANGWNSANVTVTFSCTTSGMAIPCASPQTISTEGANQVITGTVTDASGHSLSTGVTLNIDKTIPILTVTSPADGTTFSSASVALAGTVSDALSGVSAVTCDGVSALLSGGNFSCNISLNVGVNLVVVRATDLAGNVAGSNFHVRLTGTLPAPQSLQISPSVTNMLVGQTQQFTAMDNMGRPRADAMWAVSDSTVATISTDSSPLLTAVAVGQVTLTATVGSTSAQAQVNILSGSALPTGTALWSAPPPLPGYAAKRILQAVPGSGSPDVYSIEEDSTYEHLLVRALTGDGQQLWMAQVTGTYVDPSGVPDGYGGLLLAVFTGTGQSESESIVDLDGQTGSQRWAYQPLGRNSFVAAVGNDGKVYVYEVIQSLNQNESVFTTHLTVLDGLTGALLLNYEPPQYTATSINTCSGQTTIKHYPSEGPYPISVGPNGTVLGIVTARDNVGISSCTSSQLVSLNETSSLFQLSPGGSVTLTPFYVFTAPLPDGGLPNLVASSVVPDGQGGELIPYTITTASATTTETHVTHLSVSRHSDYALPSIRFPSQMVLGENNLAYATDHDNVIAFDFSSGQPLWAHVAQSSQGLNILGATAASGLAINDLQAGVVSLDPNGNSSPITAGGTLSMPSYSWTGSWIALPSAASGASAIVLPVAVDPASLWATPRGNPSENGASGALCDCLVETTDPAPPPPPATCPICNLASNTLPPSQGPSCTSTPGTLSTYLILVGDSSTSPTGDHNVGNLFNLSAQTQANSLQAQGHPVVACRVSTVQHVQQALTLSGLTFDGGVFFFGHAGFLQLPGTSSFYSLLSVGQQNGDDANISFKNVSTLSNAQLGPNAMITLNACNAGLSLSPGQPPVAQLIANRLRRNVYAHQVGMYFSQNPNDTHRGGIGQAPSSLPMYMLPQGAVPKPKPTQFRPQ